MCRATIKTEKSIKKCCKFCTSKDSYAILRTYTSQPVL